MSLQLLLINKPPGPSSHDIIDQLRKITGVKKIGHSGTLDPFAQGLLLIAVGRESTQKLSKFVGLDKEYMATLQLGAVSDSYDCTGKITKTLKHLNTKTLKKKDIENVLQKFIGPQEQLPPMFSAKKVNGKKLYELARKGIETERRPHKIKIYDIKIKKLEIRNMKLEIIVRCSSGTYIRALASDIGQALGCGAYLEKLVRTKIGKFELKKAVEINQLTKDNWQNYLFNPKI